MSSLLQSIWCPLDDPILSHLSTTTTEASHKLQPGKHPQHKKNQLPMHTSTHVLFTLSDKLYTWLELMAVLHNYGSVHKSIRDLLCWACTGKEEDLEWIFSTPHHITPTSINQAMDTSLVVPSRELYSIAHKQHPLIYCDQTVALGSRVSDALYAWISAVVNRYELISGASDVLECIVRCAIELGAAEDIFNSSESGHNLPKTSADLFYDLGILRWHGGYGDLDKMSSDDISVEFSGEREPENLQMNYSMPSTMKKHLEMISFSFWELLKVLFLF